ncbi:MAG: Mu-like prophage major head subunit gpT family protein [Methylibium sp.]|nr:Mu-like prophage major head subunit gpT family protein [Methylibium sp.]
MMLNNATIVALNTSFNTSYQKGYSRRKPWWNRLAMKVTSSTPLNTYGWMARLGQMRKWIGERQVNNLKNYVYQLLNESYEYTLGVLKDDIADDQVGIYSPIFEQMGETSIKWPDQLVKAALQAGTTQVTFDGVAFFGTAHPLSGTSQSNLFAGTPLTAANYDIVRIALSQIKGEDGELINEGRATLVVPTALETTARTILNAQLVASGGVAVTNVLENTSDLLVLDELNNEPTVWYIMYLDGAIKPLVFQEREAPKRVNKDSPTDDNVFWKRELIWGTEARGAAGYGTWWKAARAAA